MSLATQSTKIALATIMTFVGWQVRAQSASSAEAEIAALKKQLRLTASSAEEEIAALKKQLRLMDEKLDRLQKQTAAKTVATAKATAKTEATTKVTAHDANSVVPAKALPPRSDVIVTMPNNRPTICTADEQNCISLTSRLHFDVGGYDYRPNTANTNPQQLDDGVNARRARIGVIGKFLSDWHYALIYDFGGSSDGFAGTASAGGTPVGFLPGGALSGILNAYLSYSGIRPFGGQLAIEGGYMKVPFTLGEATSSNDILFLERASSQVIAVDIAAGNRRSAFGARWYNDIFWAGAYATGPEVGALHSASSTNPDGTTEQFGATARVAGQVISGNDYSLHIGADAEFLISPPHNLVDNSLTLTLSDRPELRIDPTAIIDTGSITGVSGAQVYSAEAAATYGPLFFQGEYFRYNVARNNLPGLPSLKFDGAYAQASLVLTGETHPYIPAHAAYGGITPANPFSLSAGGWGAWEIAGRISTVNLNDQLGTATGVAGGRQTIYTAALNWYVNSNVRFMFDYLHGNIAKQVSPTDSGDAGAKFDAVAMRTQVAF
jgi:phosphate-selective porin OprO and OprP